MNITEAAQKIAKAKSNLASSLPQLLSDTRDISTSLADLKDRLGTRQRRIDDAVGLMRPALNRINEELSTLPSFTVKAWRETSQAISNARTHIEQTAESVERQGAEIDVACRDLRTLVTQSIEAQRRETEQMATVLSDCRHALKNARDSLTAQMGRVKSRLDALCQEVSRLQTAVESDASALAQQLEKGRAHCHETTDSVGTEEKRLDSEANQKIQQAYLDIIETGLSRIGSLLSSGIEESVLIPTRTAVGEFVSKGIDALASELEKSSAALQPPTQKLDQLVKELTAGPQLRPLLRASAGVLNKIGKGTLLPPNL